MKAVILAGGLGTRLRAEVPDLPKPLAPVGGRPFLAWQLDALAAAGLSEVILSVGYRAKAINGALGNQHGSLSLSYIMEETPLGTGGALRRAFERIPLGEPVWAMNGDTFVELDYERMRAQHGAAAPGVISMALTEVADGSRYGTVEVEGGRVVRFKDKGASARALINAGVYLLHPDLFRGHTLPNAFSFERDFLAARLKELEVRAFETGGYFIDIGVPADYARAQTELPALFARRA